MNDLYSPMRDWGKQQNDRDLFTSLMSKPPQPTSIQTDAPQAQTPGFDLSSLKQSAPGFMNKDKGFLGNFFGSKNDAGDAFTGWGMPTIDLATGVADTYMNWQNMNTAKDTLKFQKQAFSDQFNTQKNLINTDLEDRQRRRVSYNPDQHMSVDEYMKKNGL